MLAVLDFFSSPSIYTAEHPASVPSQPRRSNRMPRGRMTTSSEQGRSIDWLLISARTVRGTDGSQFGLFGLAVSCLYKVDMEPLLLGNPGNRGIVLHRYLHGIQNLRTGWVFTGHIRDVHDETTLAATNLVRYPLLMLLFRKTRCSTS